MNKKLNTALFLVVATVANIVIMLILLLVPLFLYLKFIAPYTVQTVTTIAIVIIFTGSILATFLVYNALMRKFSKTVDMDKYFDPIFKKQGKRN